MSEFSVDCSIIRRHHQRHPTTPASSRSFNAAVSRRYAPSPATPFATDDDTSWQGEISWQFEPSGWQVGRSLGAALSPWPTPTSTAPAASRPRRTFRSANDYYLSDTYGGSCHRSLLNPSFEFSTVRPPPSRRIELQSFVGSENQSSQHTSSAAASAPHGFSRRKAGNSPATASRDELSTDIDYRESDYIVDKVHVKGDAARRQQSSNLQRHHSSSNQLLLTDDIRSHEASKLHHIHGQASHNVRREVDDDGNGVHDHAPDYDDEEEEEEEEDEIGGGRAVGLFGLFRYSTRLDMVVLLLGCFGALINGGSLPWYSFLFGNFVNKITDDNKNQIMEDVRQVCLKMVGLAAVVVIGAYMEITCWRIVGERSAQRIRTEYLRAILRQDIGFFDTRISTGDIMHGISSDVSQIQEVMSEKVGELASSSSSSLIFCKNMRDPPSRSQDKLFPGIPFPIESLVRPLVGLGHGTPDH
ncbi:hypothetical protein ACLOJK_025820 [Asimina triloba]